MRADYVKVLAKEIENLIIDYPELQDDDELRADMIEGSTDAEAVMERLLDQSMNAQSMVNAIKSRKTDLAEREARFKRRDAAMRELMMKIMSASRQRKFELAEATISMRNTAPKLHVDDEAGLPEDYLKVETKADKKKIADDLKAGTEIPGCYMDNGGETISIRCK